MPVGALCLANRYALAKGNGICSFRADAPCQDGQKELASREEAANAFYGPLFYGPGVEAGLAGGVSGGVGFCCTCCWISSASKGR